MQNNVVYLVVQRDSIVIIFALYTNIWLVRIANSLHLFIAWNNAKCTDSLSICALESSVDFSISWNWSCCKKCIFGKKHRVHVLVPCTIQLSIGAKKTIDSPVCKKETQNNYAYHCISEHKKKNSARVHLFDDAICINMEYLFIRVCRLLQQFSMPFC